ncbi:unnamed protein product [Adineta steineri]|uniref:WSC domain-containing protein n=1 Tax=Adineta steineri TaxID=433720 RepID=A0A813MCY2_9BILA|nr:unnamed protein product [Adineta steineri]
MYHLLKYIFILFSINQSIYCSYRYAGCYTHVFFNTYFTSSFMEPTLCFRLCDTPIIYLQKTICRCSGGGLMHYDEQPKESCSTPCTKPVDRSIISTNTCGGSGTYSVYVQNAFYSLHGHLFTYKIQFSACELWKNSDVYETYSVKLSGISVKSSLSKLEKCAAACLDQNATTKSIGFNDDSDKCLCIMPLKPAKYFERTHYVEALSNNSCDRYCNNIYEGSKSDLKYQCGSLTDPKIWAIYDLNGTCPIDYVYMQELNKCVYKYKNFWNSCTPPAVGYIHNGNFSWNGLLKMIGRLQLNESAVTIEFDDDTVVDSTWKCAPVVVSSPSYSSNSWRSYLAQARSTLYGVNSVTRYILESGCLREISYSSYAHRYSYRLCVTDPINKYSSNNNEDSIGTQIFAINPDKQYCPTNWFDLNGRCYRISDERKTIEEARNSCISVSSSSSTSTTTESSKIWLIGDTDKNEDNELSDTPTGEIVEYISEWQSRLGFFLLDTDPDHDEDYPDATTSLPSIYYDEALISSDSNNTANNTHHGAINEFHIIEVNENNTKSSKDNTCFLVTRSISEEEEKPILQGTPIINCSKPRHVLCETNTLIVQNFQTACLRKPKALDLPALISNQLTHELCLHICQELQTKLAVLHINKCYCLNGATPGLLNITTDFKQFQQKTCGNPCPGNSHEMCGNEDTIVAYQILDSRRTFTFSRTPAEPFPKYTFDSCINLNFFNQSTTYQFTIQNQHDFHPRYCLKLCTKYNQKYALINNGTCLCTNTVLKGDEANSMTLPGQNCSQLCPGNHFYSCGHKDNKNIYSMYILKPKCRHGFEVAENNQQCVYSYYATKVQNLQAAQNYCRSIGTSLAKIKDIIQIQDILPESILHTRLMQQLLVFYKFKYVNDTRYYWIDRTDVDSHNNTISDRLLKQCSDIPELIDRNCISVKFVANSNESQTTSHERCIIESNACLIEQAMPICVDQHIELKPELVPPIADDDPSDITVDIVIDHSCGDENNDYHFVDDYCYKVFPEEVSWNDAKLKCQLDNATIFVPEKSVALQYVKSLFLRQKTYASSSFAHVGVYYDNLNKTVVQYNTLKEGDALSIPNSNAIYNLCEKTFQERYTAVMSSSALQSNEKNQLKKQQLGCAYMDITPNAVPTIRCDEIPCSLKANVICQKLPTLKTSSFTVTREYIVIPPTESTQNIPYTTTATILSDDQTTTTSPSSSDSVSDDQSENDSTDIKKSVGRDFAPIFFILTIIFSLIILGFISTIYNHRGSIFRRSHRRTPNSVYSQLTSANDFDLN